jgi:hypothetical protein
MPGRACGFSAVRALPVLGALPAPLAVYSYLVGGVSYSNVQYKLNLRGCLVDWGVRLCICVAPDEGPTGSRPADANNSGGRHGSFSLEHLRQSATSHCGSRSGEPCSIVEAAVLVHPKQGRWPPATDPAWACTWAGPCTGRCIGFAHGRTQLSLGYVRPYQNPS